MRMVRKCLKEPNISLFFVSSEYPKSPYKKNTFWGRGGLLQGKGLTQARLQMQPKAAPPRGAAEG